MPASEATTSSLSINFYHTMSYDRAGSHCSGLQRPLMNPMVACSDCELVSQPDSEMKNSSGQDQT